MQNSNTNPVHVADIDVTDTITYNKYILVYASNGNRYHVNIEGSYDPSAAPITEKEEDLIAQYLITDEYFQFGCGHTYNMTLEEMMDTIKCSALGFLVKT